MTDRTRTLNLTDQQLRVLAYVLDDYAGCFEPSDIEPDLFEGAFEVLTELKREVVEMDGHPSPEGAFNKLAEAGPFTSDNAAPFAKQIAVTILFADANDAATDLDSARAARVLQGVWNPSEIGSIQRGSWIGEWLVDFREDTAAELLAQGYQATAVVGGVRYLVDVAPVVA